MGKSERSGGFLFAAFEIEIIKALKNVHQGTNISDENRGAWEKSAFFLQQSLYRKKGA